MELFHLWVATAKDVCVDDQEEEEIVRCRTSSIIWHICRKHDSIDSSFPEIVTARSVDVGNISDATCTDAPVV